MRSSSLSLTTTDLGLAIVSLLIVRIVYLVGRIEWVMSRSKLVEEPPVDAHNSKGEVRKLPHVHGVLVARDNGQASSPHKAFKPAPVQVDSAELPVELRRAVTTTEQPAESSEAPLRRSVTIAGGDVKRIISPLGLVKRRSSRGSVLNAVIGSPLSDGTAIRIQTELEALDVLPLTTPDEAPLLMRMRIEVTPDLADFPQHDDVSGDIRLLRFLRGYGHSVSQACAAYREMLATRRLHDVESIVESIRWEMQKVLARPLLAEDMPNGREIYPMYPLQINCGLSSRGHLVSIDPIGAIQLGRLMDEVGPDKLFEFMIGVSELRQIIMDEMSLESRQLVQSVQIKDLHGLGLSAFRDARAISTLQAIVSTCTSMYPESLATLYIINAPFFFPMAWSVVSTFVSERTKRKIHVLGTDYTQTLVEDVGSGVIDILNALHENQRALSASASTSLFSWG